MTRQTAFFTIEVKYIPTDAFNTKYSYGMKMPTPKRAQPSHRKCSVIFRMCTLHARMQASCLGTWIHSLVQHGKNVPHMYSLLYIEELEGRGMVNVRHLLPGILSVLPYGEVPQILPLAKHCAGSTRVDELVVRKILELGVLPAACGIHQAITAP